MAFGGLFLPSPKLWLRGWKLFDHYSDHYRCETPWTRLNIIDCYVLFIRQIRLFCQYFSNM